MKVILFQHPSISLVEESVDDGSLLFLGREFARQSGDDICAIFHEPENRARDYPLAAEAYGLANRLGARILLVGPPDLSPFDNQLIVPHGPQIIHLGISGAIRVETVAEKSTPECGIPTFLPENAYALIVTEEDDCKLFTPATTDKNAKDPIPYFAGVLIAIANKLGDEEWTNTLLTNEFPEVAG